MIAVGSQRKIPWTAPKKYTALVLDHDYQGTIAPITPANWSFETTWLLNENSYEKQTAVTVYFWMRETAGPPDTFKVEVYRDWRKSSLESHEVSAYSIQDAPPFWGSAVLGSAGTTYRNRRPYWCRAEIFVPSCEVFKIRAFTDNGMPAEFIGLSFDFIPHPSGGARVQP